MNSLWGSLDDVKDFKIPKSILEEQALYIAKMTNNTLYAEVLVDNKSNSNTILENIGNQIVFAGKLTKDKYFYYKLVIKSDYLDKYEFKVLTIKHGILQYPVEIIIPSEIAEDLQEIQEIKDELPVESHLVASLKANNEEEFIFYLSHILKSKYLMQVIKALYKMSEM